MVIQQVMTLAQNLRKYEEKTVSQHCNNDFSDVKLIYKYKTGSWDTTTYLNVQIIEEAPAVNCLLLFGARHLG